MYTQNEIIITHIKKIIQIQSKINVYSNILKI